jgi:hypothetical protein
LALARHQAIAKQHFRNQVGTELRASSGTFYGRFDGSATQVVSRQGRKVALKAAHGCARCADDDDGVMGWGHLKFSRSNEKIKRVHAPRG